MDAVSVFEGLWPRIQASLMRSNIECYTPEDVLRRAPLLERVVTDIVRSYDDRRKAKEILSEFLEISRKFNTSEIQETVHSLRRRVSELDEDLDAYEREVRLLGGILRDPQQGLVYFYSEKGAGSWSGVHAHSEAISDAQSRDLSPRSRSAADSRQVGSSQQESRQSDSSSDSVTPKRPVKPTSNPASKPTSSRPNNKPSRKGPRSKTASAAESSPPLSGPPLSGVSASARLTSGPPAPEPAAAELSSAPGTRSSQRSPSKSTRDARAARGVARRVFLVWDVRQPSALSWHELDESFSDRLPVELPEDAAASSGKSG